MRGPDWFLSWDTGTALTVVALYLAISLAVFRGAFGPFHRSCLRCMWEQLTTPWASLQAHVARTDEREKSRRVAPPSIVATWVRGAWVSLGVFAILLLAVSFLMAWDAAQPWPSAQERVELCEKEVQEAERALESAESAVKSIEQRGEDLPEEITIAEEAQKDWRAQVPKLAEDAPLKQAMVKLDAGKVALAQARAALEQRLAGSKHPDLEKTLAGERDAIRSRVAEAEASEKESNAAFEGAVRELRAESSNDGRAVLSFLARNPPDNEEETLTGVNSCKAYLEEQAGRLSGEELRSSEGTRKKCVRVIDAWATLWRARHKAGAAKSWKPSRDHLPAALRAALDSSAEGFAEDEARVGAATNEVTQLSAAVEGEERALQEGLQRMVSQLQQDLEAFPRVLEAAENEVPLAEHALAGAESELDDAEDNASIRWGLFLWTLLCGCVVTTLLLWLPALCIELLERWWLTTGVILARAEPPATGPAPHSPPPPPVDSRPPGETDSAAGTAAAGAPVEAALAERVRESTTDQATPLSMVETAAAVLAPTSAAPVPTSPAPPPQEPAASEATEPVHATPVRAAEPAVTTPVADAGSTLRSDAPTQPPVPSPGSPPDKLWVLDPDGAWRLVRIPLGRMTIGREARCAVQLAHGQVSSMHAQFVRTVTATMFMDLNSTNGSTLNGMQVREPEELHGGDVLMLGNAEIRVGEEHEVFRAT